MKTCITCNEEKELNEFTKNLNRCKECISDYNKKYRENNKEKLSKSAKYYYNNNNKEYYKDYYNEYKNINKENISIRNKNYRENNKDYFKDYNKNYYEKYVSENKEKISERRKIYYNENKDKAKEYYINNREQILINKKNEREVENFYKLKYELYFKVRRDSDPLFKLSSNIRNLIKNSFYYKGYSKKSKTTEILGCSFEEFKIYLESKFEDWMTWENRALYNGEFNYGWDIDHIIPLSSAKTEEDIIRLNHYTNLQPLCSYTNRYIKKDTY